MDTQELLPACCLRAAGVAVFLVLSTGAACDKQREADARVTSSSSARTASAPPPRCGPGLAAEDLAGNCRRKECPTMGALEAVPLDAPCPQAKSVGAPAPKPK
jgi:hypothetical protein